MAPKIICGLMLAVLLYLIWWWNKKPKPATTVLPPAADEKTEEHGHDDHPQKEKGLVVKVIERIILLVPLLLFVYACLWFYNNHNDSLARKRLEDQQRMLVTQSDPKAYWWTLYLWSRCDENKVLVTSSPFVRFTKWTTEEMEFVMPLQGDDSKFNVFKMVKGERYGHWHEEIMGPRGQMSGWFCPNSFPTFDGNVNRIEGIWRNGPDKMEDYGCFVLVRGRLKTEDERRLLK